jgi:hypothetical protein
MTSPAPTKRSNDSANTTPRKRHRSSQVTSANAAAANRHTPTNVTATTITQIPSPPSPKLHTPKPSSVLTLPTVIHCLEATALNRILESLPEDELRALLTAHVSQSSNQASTFARKVATTYDATNVAEPKPSKHIIFEDMVQDTIIVPLRRFAGGIDAEGCSCAAGNAAGAGGAVGEC